MSNFFQLFNTIKKKIIIKKIYFIFLKKTYLFIRIKKLSKKQLVIVIIIIIIFNLYFCYISLIICYNF